jgi:hypothetical protein
VASSVLHCIRYAKVGSWISSSWARVIEEHRSSLVAEWYCRPLEQTQMPLSLSLQRVPLLHRRSSASWNSLVAGRLPTGDFERG